MTRSFLLEFTIAAAIALFMSLLNRGRAREIAPDGAPILRYLAAPYLTFACALVCIKVGIDEWSVPFNHHHSGNLLILSYIPTAAGIISLCMSVYLYTFRATLSKTAIEVKRWPFGTIHFNLADLEGMDTKGKATVLRFSGGKKFAVYPMHSGHIHFLATLNADDSLKQSRHRGSA